MTGFNSKRDAAADKLQEPAQLTEKEKISREMTAEIAAARALAQPAQEPVALPCCGYADASAIKWNPYNQVVQCHNCGQVYTTPLQRKPLTDENIGRLAHNIDPGDWNDLRFKDAWHNGFKEGVRASEIERGVKENNNE